MWRRCIDHAYAPERLFKRFAHQVEATYANRLVDSPVRGKLTWNKIGLALVLAFNIARHIGLRADYRRSFWKAICRRCATARSMPRSRWGCRASHHYVFARSRAGRAKRLVLSAQTRQCRAAPPRPNSRSCGNRASSPGRELRPRLRPLRDSLCRPGDLTFATIRRGSLRIADLRLRTAFGVNTGTALGASQCSA